MAAVKKYASMSLAQLKREKDKIEKLIAKAESRDRKKAMAELAATARKNGFDLQELIEGAGTAPKRGPGRPRGRPPKAASGRGPGRPPGKKKATRKKVAPKYRNPADSSETWTGRGKQPRWVQAWVKQGKSLDDVRI